MEAGISTFWTEQSDRELPLVSAVRIAQETFLALENASSVRDTLMIIVGHGANSLA